jgi:hypothetical protein
VRSEQKVLAREGEYSSGILQEETVARTKKLDALDGFNPMQRRQMGNGLGASSAPRYGGRGGVQPVLHEGLEASAPCGMAEGGGEHEPGPKSTVPFFYLIKKSKDLNRFDHKRAFSNSKNEKYEFVGNKIRKNFTY